MVLPLGVSQEALIQCPYCHQQIILGEALTSQFGSWVVISDPATSLDTGVLSLCETSGVTEEKPDSAESSTNDNAPVTTGIGPTGPGDAADYRESVPASSASAAPKTELNWSDFKSLTRDQTQRLKRKSTSPVWSIIQVVFGGLAAVPIALLLLWWVLGKDIAGAGPIIGKHLPWIVPEAFRPIEESPAVARRRPPLASPTRGLPQLSDASVFRSPAGVDPLVADPLVADPLVADPLVADPIDADPRDTPPLGTESLTALSPGLLARIADCQLALDEWREAVRSGDGDLKPIARSVYGALIDMTSVINDLPTETSGVSVVQVALRPIVSDIERHADLQSVVAQGAVYWFEKNSETDEFPLVALVEVAEVVERPESWLVTPSATKAWPQSLDGILIPRALVPRALAPSLTPGQQLFVLGKVGRRVDQPAAQRPIFDGWWPAILILFSFYFWAE